MSSTYRYVLYFGREPAEGPAEFFFGCGEFRYEFESIPFKAVIMIADGRNKSRSDFLYESRSLDRGETTGFNDTPSPVVVFPEAISTGARKYDVGMNSHVLVPAGM